MLISGENLFTSEIFWIIIYAFLGYIALLWMALVIWVARDSVSRTNSLIFQIFAIMLTIALPLFGLLVYLIIRPSKTLATKYYEEMEYRALMEGVSGAVTVCPKCGESVGTDFAFCPKCSYNIRQECKKCKRLYDTDYDICPYCGNPKDAKKASVEKTKKSK